MKPSANEIRETIVYMKKKGIKPTFDPETKKFTGLTHGQGAGIMGNKLMRIANHITYDMWNGTKT